MTRTRIAIALVLLLGVSPALPSFADSSCGRYGAPSGFHLADQVRAHNDHDHGDDHGEVSHHSDDVEAHHDGSHQDRDIDGAARTHTGAAAPGSCSCSTADPSTPQSVAVLTTSEINRKVGKVAPGNVVSARDSTLDHSRFGTHVVAGRDKYPPVSDLFLLYHSFLI